MRGKLAFRLKTALCFSTTWSNEMDEQQSADRLALIANVVSSYLRRNSVGAEQIGSVMVSVTRALNDAEKMLVGVEINNAAMPQDVTQVPREPAVSPRSSVKPDYIVCL